MERLKQVLELVKESNFKEANEICFDALYSKIEEKFNEKTTTVRESCGCNNDENESVQYEASDNDGDEYNKFFQSALKKFGVSSPGDLEGDKKKKFYDYVDKNWKSDKEKETGQEDPKEAFDPSSYKVDHQQAIKSLKNNIKIARLRLQDNPKPEERTKLNLSIQNSQKSIKKHQEKQKDSAAA
jgi:hypothetical protein